MPPQMKAIDSMESMAVVDQRAKGRRATEDRRKTETKPEFVAEERRVGERRVKVERRRQIDPTTCERDYTDDPGVFVYRRKVHGQPYSELRIKPAKVIRAAAPNERYEIDLALRRP